MKDKKNEAAEEVLMEEVPAVDAAIDPVVEELKAAKDQLMRLAAEFDNFRKRSLKERDEIALRAKIGVLKEFLPVMDNFERAACTCGEQPPAAQSNETAAAVQVVQKGMEMIFGQFSGVMESLGVQAFGAAGDAFDPTLHHAVAHVDDPEQEQSVVAEVYGKGYLLDGKLLREAVVVTKG